MRGTIVIAGGGTGGHLFPGIALAEEFTRRKEGWEVVFVGTGKGLEQRVLPRWGFDLVTVPAAPLKGRGWWGKVAGLVTLFAGVWWSWALLRRISPCLVIGLGGYSAGAVVLAAYLLGIKRVIQEQNVYPGFTNRTASRFSHRVFLSWGEGARFFPSAKVRVTGNPLRSEVLRGRGEKRVGIHPPHPRGEPRGHNHQQGDHQGLTQPRGDQEEAEDHPPDRRGGLPLGEGRVSRQRF
jgi:UDP-N-acetylglucosamine--N-acetylmuramyl-(pentapeptide) pyrophosphoryl-undecaprenol N-acetylglucosamine transferase